MRQPVRPNAYPRALRLRSGCLRISSSFPPGLAWAWHPLDAPCTKSIDLVLASTWAQPTGFEDVWLYLHVTGVRGELTLVQSFLSE